MQTFTKSSLTAPFTLLSALVISACSSGGTVTTLDANPQVPISLPLFLLDASQLDSNNLSPTILLSTGATVSMQKGNGNEWSGTINVTPGTSFTATVTWNEAYLGLQLPLARRVETLEVATDGTVVTTNSTDYTTEIDNDGDGTSNFQERINGSDPLTAPTTENTTPPEDDTGSDQSTQDTTNPATAPAQTPSNDDAGSSNTNQNSDQTDDTSGDSSSDSDSSTDTTSSSSDNDASSNTASDSANTGSSTSNSDSDDSTDDDSASDAPVVVDVIVPRIAAGDAPVIDGNDVTMHPSFRLTGEWAAAVQTDVSGAELAIENLMIDDDAETVTGVAFRRWGAMHDGDYLYIVVVVDDNGDRRRDSGSDLVNDDSLELFLDGDNSKSSSYGSDDFHRIFPGKLAGVDKQSASSGDIAGPNSSSSSLDVTFATGPGIGPRGIRRPQFEQDVYEIRIDLSSAGIDTDNAFGFELQVNDDDGGGSRNGKFGWKHPAGNGSDVDGTQSNPSLMGTLKLE